MRHGQSFPAAGPSGDTACGLHSRTPCARRRRHRPRRGLPRTVHIVLLCAALAGCVGVPEGLSPVGGFDASRYLGTWYEIARYDHGFERGLTHVSATYGRREDGGLTVVNRGYDAEDGEWREARGRAYFVESPDEGYLKVSFFGPFYGSYVVFRLDEDDYRWSLVTGPNRDYFWLLARDRVIDATLRERLLEHAEAAGFDRTAMIFVDQSDPPPPAPD